MNTVHEYYWSHRILHTSPLRGFPIQLLLLSVKILQPIQSQRRDLKPIRNRVY